MEDHTEICHLLPFRKLPLSSPKPELTRAVLASMLLFYKTQSQHARSGRLILLGKCSSELTKVSYESTSSQMKVPFYSHQQQEGLGMIPHVNET
jgi:hypothetical protein